mmetsp:Transcript_33881/g.85757  ORF Transcript_33881/g.85757 Transcript_33881/m.85757 type:complete len:214 (-) Transcript_33881:623-1264(-)
MSAAPGVRPCSAAATSAAALACTCGWCASSAHAQPSRMALVSCPATSSVISSSRSAWSLMPTPSSSTDVSSACSRSVRDTAVPGAAAASSARRLLIRPYTTRSSCATAVPNSRLSHVGSHSGSIMAAPARRVKNSNALATAATMVDASSAPPAGAGGEAVLYWAEGGCVVNPNSASIVMRRVSSLKSAYTSRTPPSRHWALSISAVASTMADA